MKQEANSEVQSVLLERIEILQNQNSKLMKEGESQRKQYEKCLDDVANQVVKALLTQKVSFNFPPLFLPFFYF